MHFSVTASALSPFRHCEGIYARGNPLTWNKYYTVIARAFMPAAIPCMEQVLHCHCEGIYARGNPLHGTSTVTTPSSRLRLLRRYAPRNDGVTRGIMSLRGRMRPRQSPAWNKYYTVIARAFMPVAISYMEQVQQLHRPHV